MKILVTGGAGYIGSFMVKSLIEKGDDVLVVDSLEKGHKEAVDPRAKLVVGDLRDRNLVSRIFSEHEVDVVVHFAGYISMAESMANPYIYFDNNISASLNVIESMVRNGKNNFVFSSTAGVYGNPVHSPIKEDNPKSPTNPYGESKLIVERILDWYNRIEGLSFVSLRYFNASGASMDGRMGEDHFPETHIIPNAINAVLNGKEFFLYGQDYATSDGTCVRDYIHVLDLVNAHMLAISKLKEERGGYFYNVGGGRGYSNKEVIEMVKKISGCDIKIKAVERRIGDADVLIADSTKIRSELKFSPRYSDLETIVKTAWEWHRRVSK